MVVLGVNDRVWVPPAVDSKCAVPLGSQVVDATAEGAVVVVDDEGRRRTLDAESRVRLMDPSTIHPPADLVELGDLHEAAVLRSLFVRFTKQEIYSQAGRVLIAVNPFEQLGIYTPAFRLSYLDNRLGELPPHIFATAEDVRGRAIRSGIPQSIVITGESGAGKSTTAQHALEFLIGDEEDGIGRRILDALNVIKAFGNARMTTNQDSSRVCISSTLFFNFCGDVEGARFEVRLLDFNRAVRHEIDEQNFHVFYALLAGMNEEERREFGLEGTAADYFLLSQGTPIESTGQEADAAAFRSLCDSLTNLKFSEAEIRRVFSLLAALLHLGNLRYVDSTNGVQLADSKQTELIARLLQVDGRLLTVLLTTHEEKAGGEEVCRPLTLDEALNVRDALIRSIYANLVFVLVERLNDRLQGIEMLENEEWPRVTIVDPRGFESAPHNRFDQLVVNAANECLYHAFTRRIKQDHAEYDAQKIGWNFPLEFADNSAVVDLLVAERTGLLELIEAESENPQSTEPSLLALFDQQHAQTSAAYAKPAAELSRVFGVRHFVGPSLRYTTGNWLDVRRDHLGDCLQALGRSTGCSLLRAIAEESKKKRTPAGEIRELIVQLEHTQPNFVCCIRPNRQQEARRFDRATVVEQMRAADLMSTVHFEAAGFPARHDYASFVDRFRGLVPGIQPANRTDCVRAAEIILIVMLDKEANFCLGKTRILMKNADDVALERERDKMRNYFATLIQKHTRGFLQRRRFETKQAAAVRIQRAWRSAHQRRVFAEIVSGIHRLQAAFRSQQLVVSFVDLRHRVVRLQAAARGLLFRRRLDRLPTLKAFKAAMSPERNDAEEKRPSIRKQADAGEECPFEKYAVVHFEPSASPAFTRRPLTSSLLELENGDNQRAAIILSLQIRRFMGDLPDVQQANAEPDRASTVAPSINSLESGTNGFPTPHWFQAITGKNVGRNWANEPMSEVVRVQIVVGYGILRPALRDEIYAQLLAQLNGNPTNESVERGWLLLALCAGCFLPSADLLDVVRAFARQNASVEWLEFVERRIERCALNGGRRQPPAESEIEAAKNLRSIETAVHLPTDRKVPIEVDSSTSAREICAQVAQSIGLNDRFGYALFVGTTGGLIASLGAGNDLLADAISQFEQEQEGDEKSWRLHFRKEIFTPWPEAQGDEAAVELVYSQVISGVHFGELKAKDEEVATLAAVQLFVKQNGRTSVEVEELERELPHLLPKAKRKSLERELEAELWVQRILCFYRKKFSIEQPPTVFEAKAEVVSFARTRWPLHFSRFFEVFKFIGPPLEHNAGILAVNAGGVQLLAHEESNRVLLEWTFPEITGIVACLSKRSGLDSVTIQTVDGDEFTFQSAHSADIRELIVFFIDGLRKRSPFRLLTRDLRNVHEFRAGDLLRVVDGPAEPTTSAEFGGEWLENTRTKKMGCVPEEHLLIIPTLHPPSAQLLEKLKERVDVERPKTPARSPKVEVRAQSVVPVLRGTSLDLVPVRVPHSLRIFALDHFRPSHPQRELWRHGQEPLEAALLSRLSERPALCELAVNSFALILRFMTDWPTMRPFDPLELTDEIFDGALKHEALRDELFCQLLKQLTENPNTTSEALGWRLLWLALGLFAPSKRLHGELTSFLRTRQSQRTAECVERLNETVKWNVQRKSPPHRVELEAISTGATRLFHKIFLPDGSERAVEVKSGSRAADLCAELGKQLGFKSVEGFSLFIKVGEKAISMPDREYFFDQIAQISKWKQATAPKNLAVAPPAYQVLFLRKLWIAVTTGQDPAVDLFHYHQELPKYLRGYHAVDRSEIPRLAALILRAQTRDQKEPPRAHFQQILADLVPRNVIKSQNASEWKKSISAEFKPLEGMSSVDAKHAFMQKMGELETFGCLFFEVKQSSDPSTPPNILLAVGERGVSVWNKETNEQIAHHPFDSIVNWTAGNTYFHMTLMKGGRLLVETTLGYKIDDLLTSYIRQLLSKTNAFRN